MSIVVRIWLWPSNSMTTRGCTFLLVSLYYILSREEPYTDLGADWLRRRNDEAHTRRLVAQLERLGHTVVLDPRPDQLRESRRTGHFHLDGRLALPVGPVEQILHGGELDRGRSAGACIS